MYVFSILSPDICENTYIAPLRAVHRFEFSRPKQNQNKKIWSSAVSQSSLVKQSRADHENFQRLANARKRGKQYVFSLMCHGG